MILTVGSTVVYPCQGPCLVAAIVERSVAGKPISFYHVCEISEVMGETKSAAEEQVDQALRARKIAFVSGKPNYQPLGEFSHSM